MKDSTVIGLDLGDKHTHVCVLDAETAKVVEQTRIRTTPQDVARFFGGRATCRAVLEAGAHSSWMRERIEEHGHEVLVANPRKVRMRGATNKNDQVDAEFLARMGRADPKLLYPVQPRTRRVQEALAVVRSREQLIRTRTRLVNHVRAVVKSTGSRMPTCSARTFHNLAELVDEGLLPALQPLMVMLAQVSKEILALDREIKRLCADEFPETAWLTQVPGVGDLTALTYVLIIEDPERFANSRSVGAFIGLVPRQRQSGGSDPQLRIHKAGDPILRRILVQSANYILGPFGPDTELRRFGERLIQRGGKHAKKRAKVAVARKLATVLHALWLNQSEYDPDHIAQRAA